MEYISLTSPLLYGCENWTLKQMDIRRLKAAEMKFMKPGAGHSILKDRRSETFWKN
jgi:hypothetical protein